MKVILLQHTLDSEQVISKNAAICYDGDTSDRIKNQRRLRRILEGGHLSCLRMAYATFNISDISRACSLQLVRHKHLDYLQRSQRYCREENTGVVIPDEMDESMNKVAKLAFREYDKCILDGLAPEDARYLLPAGVATELNVTGNFQAWMDFLNLRVHVETQVELRNVAICVLNELRVIAPAIFALPHLD